MLKKCWVQIMFYNNNFLTSSGTRGQDMLSKRITLKLRTVLRTWSPKGCTAIQPRFRNCTLMPIDTVEARNVIFCQAMTFVVVVAGSRLLHGTVHVHASSTVLPAV